MMKAVLLKICLLLAMTGLFGCAATSEGPPPRQVLVVPDVPGVTKLECTVANRLGCRHQGRIYPWNAWVEAKGYNSKQYAVKEVIQSANQAVVLVVERSVGKDE